MRNFSLILLVLVTIACNKIGSKPPAQYIHGKVMLTDTITQNIIDQPLSGIRVKLATTADLNNYLYTVSTDSSGYFVFDFPGHKDSTYYVFTEVNQNSYNYYGDKSVKTGPTGCTLHVGLDYEKQCVYVCYLKDSVSKGFLPDCNATLYNNQVLAQNEDSIGFVAKTISSKNGKIAFIGLREGDYYLNAKGVYSNKLILKGTKKIRIEKHKVLTPDELFLK